MIPHDGFSTNAAPLVKTVRSFGSTPLSPPSIAGDYCRYIKNLLTPYSRAIIVGGLT